MTTKDLLSIYHGKYQIYIPTGVAMYSDGEYRQTYIKSTLTADQQRDIYSKAEIVSICNEEDYANESAILDIFVRNNYESV